MQLTIVLVGCQVVGRGFASGTERVYINRTQTPIEVHEGIIPPCGEDSFTQAEIEQALAMRRQGIFPDAPPGTVDLTTIAHDAPGAPKPLIIVILADGQERAFFGTVDNAQLPPCEGRALLPEYKP